MKHYQRRYKAIIDIIVRRHALDFVDNCRDNAQTTYSISLLHLYFLFLCSFSISSIILFTIFHYSSLSLLYLLLFLLIFQLFLLFLYGFISFSSLLLPFLSDFHFSSGFPSDSAITLQRAGSFLPSPPSPKRKVHQFTLLCEK